MLDAVSISLGGIATSDTSTADAQSSLQDTANEFLTLLTTQLQNQDPTNPMDSTAMTNQLIQLSSTEQQLAQTDKLNDILQIDQANASNIALSYIGKQVDYVGNVMQFNGSPTDIKYSLPSATTTTQISISDSAGNVVYQSPGELTAGGHAFTWDGKDSNGNVLPSGNYTVGITAADSTGTAVTATTLVPSLVDGIETISGQLYLDIGDQQVPIGSVQAVRDNPVAATPPASTDDTSTDS
jgi:flagellar basal-body rod modification protein FlgD